MKPITLFASAAVMIIMVCTGCKSISVSDLNPERSPNARLLPYLIPVVDTNNIQEIYTTGVLTTTTQTHTSGTQYTSETSYRHHYSQDNVYNESSTSKSDTIRRPDLRVGDVVSIFTKEVEQNIVDMNKASSPRGYIVLNLNTRVSDSNKGLELINGLTLGTLCLLGMPGNFRSEELDITVSIYNNANTLVKSYSAVAIDEETTAMYYGYADTDTMRKAAAQALKKALKEIRGKIYREYDQIAGRL